MAQRREEEGPRIRRMEVKERCDVTCFWWQNIAIRSQRRYCADGEEAQGIAVRGFNEGTA